MKNWILVILFGMLIGGLIGYSVSLLEVDMKTLSTIYITFLSTFIIIHFLVEGVEYSEYKNTIIRTYIVSLISMYIMIFYPLF